jgi:hypothetical protein
VQLLPLPKHFLKKPPRRWADGAGAEKKQTRNLWKFTGIHGTFMEIVIFTMKNGWIFHSYVTVYQRKSTVISYHPGMEINRIMMVPLDVM